MEKISCSICQRPKAKLKCGLCSCDICKNCAQFLLDDTFSFLRHIKSQLTHSVYCPNCFTENVEISLNNYNSTMEKAKEIMIFTKSQAKETRFVKRLEEPFNLKNYADHDEIIMRMAFRAVEMDFNAVIDVDVYSEKVRMGSYQTQTWCGTGIPAHVDEKKIIKDRSFNSQPN